MEPKKQFLFEGRTYSIADCSKDDIPSHTERVLSYWKSANVDVSEQLKLLEKCIESGTAFKVVDDEGKDRAGIYYVPRKVQEGDCYYMFLDNKRMIAMLFFYLRIVECLEALYFMPHTDNFIPFQFLIDKNSIRNFHSYHTPLRISFYSNKSNHLYEDHFVRYGIKEL